jgi:hypothetical protein
MNQRPNTRSQTQGRPVLPASSRTPFASTAIAFTLLALITAQSRADEGMWLYTAPPRALLKQRYGFEPDAAWLEHLQKSSVRIGASASFVSEDGLFISNHHVGSGELHKLSDAQNDYLRDGFLARTRVEEKRCLGREVNVLESIEDVTARVNAAVKPGSPAADAFAARRAVIAAIEKESLEKTGLRSEVVTLFQGGAYHLYRYKRYTDVRLVFAPDQQIAAFGGDPDNFEYPRYDLDICLFRAYENGQPAKVKDFLRWSTNGVREDELVFVSGHPGSTYRGLTVAELDDLRDRRFSAQLQRLNRREVVLTAWSARSGENERRARAALHGVQNGRKARLGMLAGLQDPARMAEKQAAEQKLRAAIAAKPELQEALGAWPQIEQAQAVISANSRAYTLLEGAQGFESRLFHLARTLLRAAAEQPKPNGERLREFRDSNRASLELDLFAEAPIYDDFEQLNLADSLTWLTEQLGYTNALVRQILGDKSPAARAAELIAGTKMKDIGFRKRLYAARPAAIGAARDPMLELARLVDPEARRLRQITEAQDEIKKQAYARIAAAKLALGQTGDYPDATGTLRLAFGVVKGYSEDGRAVPFQTTFGGLFERARQHKQQPPFDLPTRWQRRLGQLDLSTPFNFVSTADIIGGNSGSPVVNRHGEFVGIIFDGNLQSLVLDYLYTEEQARAVAVSSQAILEALRTVYDARDLADELVRGKAK